jgi:hypothetical protein
MIAKYFILQIQSVSAWQQGGSRRKPVQDLSPLIKDHAKDNFVLFLWMAISGQLEQRDFI